MVHLQTARAARRRTLRRLTTGANTSLFSQRWGSKFPNATILYLALFGFPLLSYLMVLTAMVGSRVPALCLMAWYFFSVMVAQHGSDCKPKYSLAYNLSQMLRLVGFNR